MQLSLLGTIGSYSKPSRLLTSDEARCLREMKQGESRAVSSASCVGRRLEESDKTMDSARPPPRLYGITFPRCVGTVNIESDRAQDG